MDHSLNKYILALSLWSSVGSFSQELDQGLHQVELTVRKKGDGGVIRRAEVRVADGVYYSGPDGKVNLEVPTGEGQIVILRNRYEKLLY